MLAGTCTLTTHWPRGARPDSAWFPAQVPDAVPTSKSPRLHAAIAVILAVGFPLERLMTNTTVPEQFQDLASLLGDWAFAREAERNAVRRNSSMAELEAYYAQMLPRMEEIMAYLSDFPGAGMAPEVENLCRLAQMFIEVASAVEFYREPDLPDGFSADRFHVHL